MGGNVTRLFGLPVWESGNPFLASRDSHCRMAALLRFVIEKTLARSRRVRNSGIEFRRPLACCPALVLVPSR
jgi:hypothetical protein